MRSPYGMKKVAEPRSLFSPNCGFCRSSSFFINAFPVKMQMHISVSKRIFEMNAHPFMPGYRARGHLKKHWMKVSQPTQVM